MGNWVQRHPLAYVAVTVPLLLGGWELLARQFTPPVPVQPPLAALSIPLDPPEHNSAEFRPQPRVMILGNSQIHYVRDQEDVQTYGFPARFQTALVEQGTPAEVADLSAGGQQVLESLAILIDTFDRVRPDHVMLGLGLANMRGITIPPQLVEFCDWAHIQETAQRHLPDRIDPNIQHSLSQLYNPPREHVSAHDPTIQEQLDEQISDWLVDRSATVRHRSVMAQWLAKLPGDLERDVRQLWRKKARGQFKARTYDAGPNYDLSLAVVQIMAAFCREKQVPFTVIVMPFHPTCDPILYVREDEERLTADLDGLTSRGELQRIDMRSLLGPEHFGTFPDGSPDGLHFLASGHAVLGRAVAEHFSFSPDRDSNPPRLRVVNFEEDAPENSRSVQ